MKQRFYLYQRGDRFYIQDSRTGKQQSLETTDKQTALRLLEVKRQSTADVGFNQMMLKTCLTVQDPLLAKRTWEAVMEQMKTHGKDSTRRRCARAMQCQALRQLRPVKLIDTTAEDFLTILNRRKVSEAHYLKRLHNLAVGLGWLGHPVLAPKLWPKLHYKPKRGITLTEHTRILEAEKNAERKLYYQLLWETGAAQSDAARLTADNIDWETRVLTYFRMKTGEQAQLAIGKALGAILEKLPSTGPLFPKISATSANDRAAEFYRRCKLLEIEGVTLHSYRYAWAERARVAGMPERFAQAALGHTKAVHRAYAKNAQVVVPTLEAYEGRIIPMTAVAA